jgi:hypothetical protein
MNECDGRYRDALADVAAGARASAELEARVLAHVETCADCAAELRTLRLLRAGRPELPSALAARIDQGVRSGLTGAGAGEGPRYGRRTRAWARVPAWALAAAAVAVLALGTPTLMERLNQPGSGLPGIDDLEPTTPVWLAERSLVAGAPVLESLTDEQLARLLEEMER